MVTSMVVFYSTIYIYICIVSFQQLEYVLLIFTYMVFSSCEGSVGTPLYIVPQLRLVCHRKKWPDNPGCVPVVDHDCWLCPLPSPSLFGFTIALVVRYHVIHILQVYMNYNDPTAT